MRKIALLSSVAGFLLMSAPALAQDATQQPAPAAPAVEAPAPLRLQPGVDVKAADGTVIGKLEGARTTETGQELTVRGLDGQVRGVPVTGDTRQDGAGVAVGWTVAEYQAAPVIADAATPVPGQPVADPAAESMSTDAMDTPVEPVAAPMSETGQTPAPDDAEQVPAPAEADETPVVTPPGV